MHLHTPTALLRSFNEAQARAFYIDLLGFSVVFEHRFAPGMPLYMGIRRGECNLHLTEHTGDCGVQAGLRIACTDVDAFAAELAAKHAALGIAQAPIPQQMPWGTRDFTVTDPFGNRLTFTSAIST
jgi:uncharacterized glyoxalase superfamily protein PhnB